MSRARHLRLRVTGSLTATQPLHVGGLLDSDETDLPIAVDGQGRTYIPGTSLAGAMRAWMASRFGGFDPNLVEAMWGHENKAEDKTGSDGGASAIAVDDAIGEHAMVPEVWDSVGIDREWGTAASGVKFDRAIVPIGSTFTFGLTLDLPAARFVKGANAKQSEAASAQEEPDAKVQAALGHLLAALEKGDVSLGAAITRGLGRVQLASTAVTCEDWQSRKGIVDTLFGANTASLNSVSLKAMDSIVPHEPAAMVITIQWKPEAPTMVQASTAGVDIDVLPMITEVGGEKMALVIPGSSIKGALRAQAERIVRTVLPHRAKAAAQWSAGPERDRQVHMTQIAEPLVDELFGAPRRKRPLPGVGGVKGLLSCDTCIAETGRGSRDQWNRIAAASGAPAKEEESPAPGHGLSQVGVALRDAGLLTDAPAAAGAEPGVPEVPKFDHAYHVAVDRWTGGAAEHLLFNELQPMDVTWAPLVLRVDLEALRGLEANPQRALDGPAVALLLLLVRDLQARRIPIGTKTNRGFGAISIERVSFRLDGDVAALNGLDGCVLENARDLGGVPAACLEHVQRAWTDWIENEIRKDEIREALQ